MDKSGLATSDLDFLITEFGPVPTGAAPKGAVKLFIGSSGLFYIKGSPSGPREVVLGAQKKSSR